MPAVDPTRPGETSPELLAANPPPSLRRVPSGLPARLRKLTAERAVARCRPA